MGYPTRLTYGITTVAKQKPLGMYPFPDPFHTSSDDGFDVAGYTNDFFGIGSTTLDWAITGASSTFTATDGLGGVALVTPGGVSTATAVYKVGNSFQFVAGQEFWYVCRIKPSAVAGLVSYQFGLRNGASSTEGLWFAKAASSTSLNLVSTVSSAATTLSTGVDTAVAAQYHDVAFYYNGTDLLIYMNDNLVARVAAVTIGASGTNLTNALLTPFFQITPTATDTLSIDYVLAAEEMIR